MNETNRAEEWYAKDKDLIEQSKTEMAQQITDMPLGFDDEDSSDFIIPRIKVIQTLSPERKDKIAEEGDIINSLTKEKLNGKVFIPIFKFNNNVFWKDRADGGGILCIAKDGRVGMTSEGKSLMCAQCRKCEFDNSKTGKEAVPRCTKYINFLGIFEDSAMPIILSFSKTCYNEGKKLYSLAKVTMQNMWNYGYTLNEKLMAKGNNEWYVPSLTPAGPTSDENRTIALNMYKAYHGNMQNVAFDMDETASGSTESAPTNIDINATEF